MSRHILEIDRKRRSNFAGNLIKISQMISSETSTLKRLLTLFITPATNLFFRFKIGESTDIYCVLYEEYIEKKGNYKLTPTRKLYIERTFIISNSEVNMNNKELSITQTNEAEDYIRRKRFLKKENKNSILPLTP